MFYIIEKEEQLEFLPNLGNCYIDFIPFNNNFHPFLQKDRLSLIYLRGIDDYKGYMFCLEHNESFKLSKEIVFKFLREKTEKLWVNNKKEKLYYYDTPEKLYDINFIQNIKYPDYTNSHHYYYRKFPSISNVNCIIPISKHYEQQENIFSLVKPIIKSFINDEIFEFNNNHLTDVFFDIEKNGIKIDKNNFIEYYGEKLQHPEFNISKGRIYTQYHLYNTTGRPSNSFNNINFVALNKNDGERTCYIATDGSLLEIDFKSYHPRLIGELIGYPLTVDNIYEHLNIEKNVMFENIYGGIKKEYLDIPYFEKINNFINNEWKEFQLRGNFNTKLKHFNKSDVNNSNKLLSYIIQGLETYHNVLMLEKLIKLLENKKTKIILYTYDAFLFDFDPDDGEETLREIQSLLKYPVNIKIGKNYHNLKEIMDGYR
jgi:hypothetical protein